MLAESFDNVSHHIRSVHLHDLEYADGRLQVIPAPLGEGFIELLRAVEFLDDLDFQGYLSVISDEADVDGEVLVPQAAAFLKKVFEHIGEEIPA